MKYRENYIIFPRTLKSGKTVYYYQTYDEFGNRTPHRSTGQTSRTLANKWCQKKWTTGELVPGKTKRFGDYAGGFFKKETCPYMRRKNAKAKPGFPVVGDAYADQMASHLRLYIMPHFSTHLLPTIQPKDIDEWLFFLKDNNHLAHKTLNKVLATMRIILEEAKREKLIKFNPAREITQFAKDTKSYGALTISEVKNLLNPEKIPEYWNNEPIYYCINLLAATTGMRIGECRGLLWENFHKNHIYVCQSYGPRGMGPTKNRETRYVPLARFTDHWIRKSAYTTEGFVFSMTGDKPVPERTSARRLHNALESMGIKKAEREDRKLAFHSWRVFFNTMLRTQNITDAKIQAVIGHKSDDMTDLYTRFRPEDFTEIVTVQNELFAVPE